MATTQKLERRDIQGIVLHGYGRLRFVRYFFLGFDNPAGARSWLARITGDVTTARSTSERALELNMSLQVAFTSAGLEKLGFAASEMETFPRPFQQGMTDPGCARLLADTGENDPANWDFGGPKTPQVHALLILYADTEERRDELSEEQRQHIKASGGVVEIRVEDGYRAPDNKEHFGFRDGISQPVIEGSGIPQPLGEAPIKTGEFVLGYKNEYGEFPVSPSVPAGMDPNGYLYTDLANSGRRDLGRNGTFLVFYKLSQDVGGFWRFARENSEKSSKESPADAATRLASRMVGRWPSGAPLGLSKERDNPDLAEKNDFNFAQLDLKGHACPLGAHIRRANPRDALPPDAEESTRETRRHSLLRRGRIYGPRVAARYSTEDDGIDRGLHFVVINASIHRQFEFVQPTWINSPKFGGLYEDPEPLAAGRPSHGGRRFTIQGEPVCRTIVDLPSFVKVRGGAYFFLPSIRALRFIAQGGYSRASRLADGLVTAAE
jgi:Dyp-type peroxidase family